MKRFNNIVYVSILWKLDQCHSHLACVECFMKSKFIKYFYFLIHPQPSNVYIYIWNCANAFPGKRLFVLCTSYGSYLHNIVYNVLRVIWKLATTRVYRINFNKMNVTWWTKSNAFIKEPHKKINTFNFKRFIHEF